MSKKNRKRNRKKKQLLSGAKGGHPSICPLCKNKTIVRVSQRTRQKFVGCLGFPGCNWSYNLNNVNNPIPKFKPKVEVSKTKNDMESYYFELQLLCDVGNEAARKEMDKLEKNFGSVYA